MSKIWSYGWYRLPRDPHFLFLSQDFENDKIRLMWIDGRHEDVDADKLTDAVWVSAPKNRPPR